MYENLERLGVKLPFLSKNKKDRRYIELVDWLNQAFIIDRIEEHFCFRKFIFENPENLQKF